MLAMSRRSLGKKIICGKCKLQVKEGEGERCHKCLEIYRVLRTNLNKRQFNRLLNNKNEKIRCQVCRGSGENA